MTRPERRWLALPRPLFRAAASDRRDLHLAVIGCFAEALFEPAINLESLSHRVRGAAPELADDDALSGVLEQLVDWDLLEESRDDSATYADPTEFRRRTLQWSLTHEGQALVAGLEAAAARLESVASLQPAALDAIADALGEVAELAATPGSDDARLHVRLAEAEGHHRTLVDNLRAFTGDVQRLLGRSDVADAHVDRAKSAILDYLNRYVVDAERPARRVAGAVDRLRAVGLETVAERAVAGANLAPGLGDDDPLQRAVADRRRNLDALVAWFAGGADAEPAFAQLLPRGRDAILRFMRVLELRREQRRRAASLPDDLRALARAFAGCADRADAHRLWMAATGLHPARHHHLAVDDADPVEAGASAAVNPPVVLAVELRRRPRPTGNPALVPAVPDRRAARARRQRRQAEELAIRARVCDVLVRCEPARLSTFGQLGDDAFDDLLELLGQALSAQASRDGSRRTLSVDGQVEVVCYPADTDALATVRCSRGALTGPDLRVSVRLLGVDVLTGRAGWELDEERVGT